MARVSKKEQAKWNALSLDIWSQRHQQNGQWAAGELARLQREKLTQKLKKPTEQEKFLGSEALVQAAEMLRERGELEVAKSLLVYAVNGAEDVEMFKPRNGKYANEWPVILEFARRVWKNPERGISLTAMAALIHRAWVNCGCCKADLPDEKVIERRLRDEFTRPLFTTKERLRAADLDEYTLAPIRLYKK